MHQTGISMKIQFKEHISLFKNGKLKLRLVQHVFMTVINMTVTTPHLLQMRKFWKITARITITGFSRRDG